MDNSVTKNDSNGVLARFVKVEQFKRHSCALTVQLHQSNEHAPDECSADL